LAFYVASPDHVISLVFLLVKPFWPDPAGQPSRKLALIDAALADRPAMVAILDSLRKNEYAVEQLPDATDSLAVTNYWGLLRQIDFEQPTLDTVLLFTTPALALFDGARPALSFYTQWVAPPPEAARTFPIEAWRAEGQIRLLLASATDTALSITTYALPARANTFDLGNNKPKITIDGQGDAWTVAVDGQAISVRNSIQQKIAVRYNKTYAREERYLTAAIEAVSRFTAVPFEIDRQPVETSIKDADFIFWLADTPAPDLPDVITLDKAPLHLENYLRVPTPALADALLEYFFMPYSKKTKTIDRRWIAETQRQPVMVQKNLKEALKPMQAGTSYPFPIWLITLILFVVERIYAYGKQTA
jgi:hypothetical protein